MKSPRLRRHLQGLPVIVPIALTVFVEVLVGVKFNRKVIFGKVSCKFKGGQNAIAPFATSRLPMLGQTDNPFEDEAVASSTARVQKVLRALLAPKRIAIVLIAMIYGAGNVLIPQVLSSSFSFQEMLAFFFVGALAAEIGLLAFGVAFTSGSLLKTFTLNSTLMVFLCASYIVGLNIAASGMPREAALFLFGTGIGAFLLTTICMLVIRWFCGIRIEHQSVSDFGSSAEFVGE